MMTDNNDDYDLRALREFRGALDEPPDGVLVRGRYRLASSDHRPPRRRRQWLLASAGAAAAVAVVVGAAAVAGGAGKSGGDGGQQAAGKPSVAPVTDKADKDLPVTPGTRAPAGAPIVNGGDPTHAKAVAAMDRLAAAAAGTAPLEIGGGKVLYVKSYNLTAGPGAYVHETWVDPQTLVPLRIRRSDGGATNIDDTQTQAEIDSAAAQPADMYRPTREYLASLPTDPAQLLAAWRHWSEQTYPGRAADGMIWKDSFELLHSSEPFWTPAQRTTIYKALALMPDAKAESAKIGGHDYDVLCLYRGDAGPGGTTDCLLFDSATGRFAGDAGATPNLELTDADTNLLDFGTQPRPEPSVKPSATPTKGNASHAPKK